jgi:hypothetical protein
LASSSATLTFSSVRSRGGLALASSIGVPLCLKPQAGPRVRGSTTGTGNGARHDSVRQGLRDGIVRSARCSGGSRPPALAAADRAVDAVHTNASGRPQAPQSGYSARAAAHTPEPKPKPAARTPPHPEPRAPKPLSPCGTWEFLCHTLSSSRAWKRYVYAFAHALQTNI